MVARPYAGPIQFYQLTCYWLLTKDVWKRTTAGRIKQTETKTGRNLCFNMLAFNTEKPVVHVFFFLRAIMGGFPVEDSLLTHLVAGASFTTGPSKQHGQRLCGKAKQGLC